MEYRRVQRNPDREVVFEYFNELKRDGLERVLKRLKRLKNKKNPLLERRLKPRK